MLRSRYAPLSTAPPRRLLPGVLSFRGGARASLETLVLKRSPRGGRLPKIIRSRPSNARQPGGRASETSEDGAPALPTASNTSEPATPRCRAPLEDPRTPPGSLPRQSVRAQARVQRRRRRPRDGVRWRRSHGADARQRRGTGITSTGRPRRPFVLTTITKRGRQGGEGRVGVTIRRAQRKYLSRTDGRRRWTRG